MTQPILYFVVPCYNEEQVLPVTAPMFSGALEGMIQTGKISPDSRIVYVDDGSRDSTWQKIQMLHEKDPRFEGISLSRNRGHQNALLGGLLTVADRCDITISIDCDGQDDIRAAEQMVDAYLDGCDVVYGVRSRRDSDSAFKRITAQGFYKFMTWMGVETVYNHADYRLLSARVLKALGQFQEVNIFLRGMIPLVGFKSTSVYYARTPRLAGESHYPLGKMMALALNGITSLSVRPIRIITGLGLGISLLSFVGVLWSVGCALWGKVVPGWASTTSILCFLGGIQLISLGVIGEYVGKIYMESKHRPRYLISETTFGEEEH